MPNTIMVIGGGDLASGVIFRLARIGLRVFVCELAEPLAVRRKVSFAEAIYSGVIDIEGIRGKRVDTLNEVNRCFSDGIVPVIPDPDGRFQSLLKPKIIIDGRMTKLEPKVSMNMTDLVIGLGPGFVAGKHCHAVIETKRGAYLGRVITTGSAEPDTGIPETVGNHQLDRVLRAPSDGILEDFIEIGEILSEGQDIAKVDSELIKAPFAGVLRGLLHSGVRVKRGMKIGDVDPRYDPKLPFLVSDKALAVSGGVMEAIFLKPELRRTLWE